MRAVVQRVAGAEVRVAGRAVGRIGFGLLAYVGVAIDDAEEDAEYVSAKLVGLRVFPDDDGRMNLSVRDAGGQVLVVPAFTTQADARQGRRPSFAAAAEPDRAQPLIERLVALLRRAGATVETGCFGQDMDVESVNAGPVCVLLDSKRKF